MCLSLPLSVPRPDAAAVRWVVGLLADVESGALPRDPAWDDVERLLRFHGLEGLAFSAHRREPDLLPVELADRLEPAYRRACLQAQLAVEAGVRARQALDEAGIPSLLYKGAALVSSGVYADPGARPMDDADLLVRPSDAGPAVAVLTDRGFRPWSPWDPARVGWLDSCTLYDPVSPGTLPVSLDLHWRLGYGGLRFGPGAGGPDAWRGRDRASGIPDPGVHLAVLGEHFLKHLRHKVHLRALGDLARLAPRIRDPEPVREALAASPHGPAIRALLGALAAEGARIPDTLLRELGNGRPRLPGWTAPALRRPGLLVGRASPVTGRVRGIFFRARLLSGPGAFLRDMIRTIFPPGTWLRARYPGTDGTGAPLRVRLRYAADAVAWLRGVGTSPVSPNQEFEDPLRGP